MPDTYIDCELCRGKRYKPEILDIKRHGKSISELLSMYVMDALEFFEYVKGDRIDKDVFEKVNITWTRVKGGEKIQPLIQKVIQEFNEENPSASVPLLLEIRNQISRLENSVWRNRKLNEVEQLIRDCTGLYIEIIANHYMASPGQQVRLAFEVINRSGVVIMLDNLKSESLAIDSTFSLLLKNNDPVAFKSVKSIKSDKEYSSPYWLKEPHATGLFTVKDRTLIGKPENDPAIIVDARVSVQGVSMTVAVPVVYKWTDPVKGELTRPFEVVPPVFVNFPQTVFIFRDQTPQTISVLVKSASSQRLKGNVKLELPAGWTSSTQPASPTTLRR